MAQLRTEVNTYADRESLKRSVARIRAKRDLKKNLPGSKAIGRVLDFMEKKKMFPEPGA